MGLAKRWRRAGACGLLALAGCAGLRTGGETAPVAPPAAAGDWLTAPARRLSDSSADQTAPSFSPDGATLIYQNNADGNWELYRLGLADGRALRITDTPEAEEDPSLSPDGRWIVCTVHAPTLEADAPREILLMSPEGKDRHVIAASGADDWLPRFTPDSRAVLFVSDRVDDRRDQADEQRLTAIFSYSLENDSLSQLTEPGRFSAPLPVATGAGLRLDDHRLGWLGPAGLETALVDTTRILGQPDWQAEAGWVAMALTPDQDGRLLVRAPQSGEWMELPLEGREADRLPAWSPDGRALAFSGRSGGQWDLFIRSR
jgi:Tol biopolymer transport system component